VWQTKPDREQKEETEQSRWGFRGMTVRNWLELLIVPLVLVGIGLLFEMQQANRQQAMEEQQQALAEQRAQDEALQAYLSQMSTLLLEKDLRNSEEDSEERTLARARTITVLGRLDTSRKTAVMQFLEEARLVREVDGREPVIALTGANLSGANLSGADLNGAKLSEADLSAADLSAADLSEADLLAANLSLANLGDASLAQADLRLANLRGANLLETHLARADLNLANLRGVDLRLADLRDANLIGANLSNADLTDANLSGAPLWSADLSEANLSGADLSGAEGITNEELEQQADSLKGATMPNGQEYED
jgi:uncharacterized protein YjbI with pentapeptide repeats